MWRNLRFLVAILILSNPAWIPLRQDAMTVPVATAGFTTRYHPDGGLVVGDQVSIQVFSPPGFQPKNGEVEVRVISPEEEDIGEATWITDGNGRQMAILLWAWDTRGLSPGEYTLSFEVETGEEAWQEKVELAEAPKGPAQVWMERDTDCCRLHYISGTAAARDIDLLAQEVDERARRVAVFMGYTPQEQSANEEAADRLDVDLVPRILGQGGFSAGEVLVSYADDNYTVTDAGIILQHELTHRIDPLMGGDFRPTMLAEGLAVYVSGGHYRPEPLILQAAFLPRYGEYLPLAILAENFYSHQHEQSYLEAGALVGYMITTWGWQGFNDFYRDIHQAEGQATSQAIDQALQNHFGMSLQLLDDRFVGWLEEQPDLPDMDLDLEVMVDYFDEIRAYQMALDPSAYFQQVWLPDPAEMRKRGIVADYLRGPHAERNQEIEALLEQAGTNWIGGQYLQAFRTLAQVRRSLAGLTDEIDYPHMPNSGHHKLKSSITRTRMINNRMPMMINGQTGMRVRGSSFS